MRALEFQELCKKNNIKKFTINGHEMEWLDVRYGFIKNPQDETTFITLYQIRSQFGDDNLEFRELQSAGVEK